jgi:prostamide/prostaglandin F2alpha synthase
LAAREISAIKPILEANQVKIIGVGLEQLGVEEFMSGNFLDGELYIDVNKKSYSNLGFKRFGLMGLFPAVLSSAARFAANRAKQLGLGGDLKGDGYQNGGALVVGKGGETLLHYVQEGAPDHVSNADVLKALGISADGSIPTAETTAAAL